MPRRSAQPPYEIMSGRHAAPPEATPVGRLRSSRRSQRRGARSWSLPDASAVWERVSGLCAGLWGRVVGFYGSLKPAGEDASPWWIGSSRPVLFRMSRGLVVGSIAGVVGLVLLAYWLGLGQGQRSTAGKPLADGTPNNQVTAPAPWLTHTGPDIPGGGDITVGPLPRKPANQSSADPRLPGHNYLVYTLTARDDAEELQAFLATHGVETLVVPTSRRVPGLADDAETGHNAVLHLVVDVTRGFSREQYARGEHHKFLNERTQLGKAWFRYNGNRGSALESMMFYKYDPQPTGGDG